MAAGSALRSVLTLLVGVAAAASASASAAEPRVISVAEAWVKMARRDVAAPVCVEGQISFKDGILGVAYVQDESGGIGFDPRSAAGEELVIGDRVRVAGFLARRGGVGMVVRHRADHGPPALTRLPRDGHVLSPMRFNLDEAAQLRIDGLLIHTSGVVRRVIRPAPDNPLSMVVEISTASGQVLARLPWLEAESDVSEWANAWVTVDAVLVCRAVAPLLPEAADALLLVPSRRSWSMQPGAFDEVFGRPAVTAATAITAAPRSWPRQRVHVIGTVTAAKAREWVTLRTEEGSVEVITRQTGSFRPGEVMAVAAWPMQNNGGLVLQDGVCRSLGLGPAPLPVRLEQGFFHGGLQRELVEVTGVITNHSFAARSPHYALRLDNGIQCEVRWSELPLREDLPVIQDGSRVRVTGVFGAEATPFAGESGGAFSVAPRSAADVALLSGPSWWTRKRLETALLLLLVVAGIALPVAAVFRWQLWRQSRHIREFEGRAAAGEERRRIAREFHDSLQQQLSAAALHLETVKGALQAAPELLPQLIDDTSAMLRHCQTEARHCIWDLRTEAGGGDFPQSLEGWLRMRAKMADVPVEFACEGPLPTLNARAPFQILRICQEAVNNALAHAEASRIQVRLRGAGRALLVEVADDGRGFDPRLVHSPKPGHYGLSSLRERALHIGADLRIQSGISHGTVVSLTVPASVPNP